MPDLRNIVRRLLIALLETCIAQGQQQFPTLVIDLDLPLLGEDHPLRLRARRFFDESHIGQHVPLFSTDENLAPGKFINDLACGEQ